MIIRMLPEMNGVSDMITTNEPGAYTLDLAVQSILRTVMKSSYSPEMVYLILSYVTGILFLFVLLKFVRGLPDDKPSKLAVSIILFFTGSIIFFLGYVETYQIVFLMMFTYLVFSILFLNDKLKNTFIPAIAFGIWLSLHYLAAVFLPSFIILLIYNFRKNKVQSVISFILFAICFVAVFIATGLEFSEMINRFISPNESHWLPLLTNSKDIIPALSFSHIWNVINAELLVLPFGLLCLTAFFVIFCKQIKWKDPSVIFLSVITLFSVIFIFLFNSYLGLAKDWDVAGLMSFPIIFFLVYLIITGFDSQTIKPVLISMSYLSFWHVMIWVILNWNINISEKRNTHLDNEYLWEKDKLGIYYEEMGIYYRNRGDFNAAIDKYTKGLQYTPLNERLILSLTGIYEKQNNLNEAEKLIDASVNNGLNDRKILSELGIIDMKLEKYDKAIQTFNLIISKSPGDIDALGNLSSCYFALKDYNKSLIYSNEVIKQAPNLPLPYIGIGDCYKSMGDTTLANINYDKAIWLDKDHIYKEIIEKRKKF
jgi:Tfp pilus assembly protein PilF